MPVEFMVCLFVFSSVGGHGSDWDAEAHLKKFFWPHHMACGILVPQLRVEPVPRAVEAWGLDHWTAGEVSPKLILNASILMHVSNV